LAHARYPDDRSGYGLAKLEDGAGVVPLGRRSERFASGDTKEAATTQPRAAKEKISSKPLRVNPRIEHPRIEHRIENLRVLSDADVTVVSRWSEPLHRDNRVSVGSP